MVKYYWKYTQHITASNIIYITDATSISCSGQYEAVTLILTLDALIIINSDLDKIQRVLSIIELSGLDSVTDPTLLSLKLALPKPEAKIADEIVIEMDPVSRARVADYVRTTANLVQIPAEDLNAESDRSMSISPDLDEGSEEDVQREQTTLTFYVNPQNRNIFLCLLAQARKQTQSYNFPVFWTNVIDVRII